MLYVEARANVLGMTYGERAILDSATYELLACVQAGLVVLVGEDGTVPDPPPVIKRPCGCGS
jgi:hypothetical protein